VVGWATAVRIKREFNTLGVAKIMGHTSQVLADRCPDLLNVFPTTPCLNRGCEFSIKQAGYLNCAFVAAEAGGEHTLDEIGDAMGITRERVRQIEVNALRKLQVAMAELKEDHANSVHQPNVAPRNGGLDADHQLAESKDTHCLVPAVHGRKLGQPRRRDTGS